MGWPRRVIVPDLGSSRRAIRSGPDADSLPIRHERKCDVVGVGHCIRDGGPQRRLLAVYGGKPIGWYDSLEVREGGDESPCYLWRLRAGESDFVKGQVDVGVPVHHRDDETHVARYVTVHAFGKHALSELARQSCRRSIACTAVVGSRKGESASERSAMSTSIRMP